MSWRLLHVLYLQDRSPIVRLAQDMSARRSYSPRGGGWRQGASKQVGSILTTQPAVLHRCRMNPFRRPTRRMSPARSGRFGALTRSDLHRITEASTGASHRFVNRRLVVSTLACPGAKSAPAQDRHAPTAVVDAPRTPIQRPLCCAGDDQIGTVDVTVISGWRSTFPHITGRMRKVGTDTQTYK